MTHEPDQSWCWLHLFYLNLPLLPYQCRLFQNPDRWRVLKWRLNTVCWGRANCSHGWCRFLCWRKFVTVVKWWHSYRVDYTKRLPGKTRLGSQKGHTASTFYVQLISRGFQKSDRGENWQMLISDDLSHYWTWLNSFRKLELASVDGHSPPIWEERCPEYRLRKSLICSSMQQRGQSVALQWSMRDLH